MAILKPGMPPDKSLVWPELVPCDCGCADGGMPPPPAPMPATDLVAAVAGSETLRRLATLADWVGAGGRPVDRRGELTRKDIPVAAGAIGVPDIGARPLRDVPDLSLLWDLALELDVLSLRHARVIPGDTSRTLRAVLRRDAAPEQALDLWDDAFDELVHPASVSTTPEQEQLREWMQPWTPHLLGNLCREAPVGGFADAEQLIGGVIAERAGHRHAEDELFGALGRTTLQRGLSLLAELGAIEVDVGPHPHEAPSEPVQLVGMAPWVASPPDGLRVRLTGLGQRSVYKRLAREHDVDVPLPAGVASG